jgi:hypothetical protein
MHSDVFGDETLVKQLTLHVNKARESFGVSFSFFAQRCITSDFAEDVIHGLSMSGDPDLAWRQMEIEQEVNSLSCKETFGLVSDDFSTDIYHLKVKQVLLAHASNRYSPKVSRMSD